MAQKDSTGHLPTSKLVFKNLTSGLTVAFIALPLALAFGIGSGLGAQAGLVTAIIAGIIAAIFGGSRYQVSGPTGAMTVILIPIVAVYGPAAILQVGLMSSAFLIAAGLLKLGRHIHKLPTALIEGFTAGIAIVIAMQQIAFILGVKLEASDHIWHSVFVEVQVWFQAPNLLPLVFGLIAILVNIFGVKKLPNFPLPLATVVGLTLLANILDLDLVRIGSLPNQFDPPTLDFLNGGNWLALVPPALAVAFLAGLESLLSAKIADKMAGSGHHNPDKELIGQGLANLAVPFFGGVPATAALARTAVNIRAGATSRLSAVSHGVFLFLFVIFLGPVIGQIPLAALGGVLVATAYHMVRPSELIATGKTSKLDGMVLVLTLIATVVLDLISALALGLVLYLALRKTRASRRAPVIDELETFGD
ncbi:MAG: sodium-independent anion transporter [Aquiluna sp.]|nr:sodium-independent anion transporter [Aquiluna sp.]MCF8546022.1 sodium-independent anion transporter [Aquiluna sp.]